MDSIATRPLEFERLAESEMRTRVESFHAAQSRRRSVRHFSSEPIPLEVVRRAIATAATAPSGANKQPWTFVLVTDPALKREIRERAEEEERAFYAGRASAEWLDDLAPLGTDARKPFLETAPALIVVFAEVRAATGHRHYYVSESVGIACGFLLAALHLAGLATLTHTPSPMAFLAEVLRRPRHERAYLMIPVGYPEPGCRVPEIGRKPLAQVLVEHAAPAAAEPPGVPGRGQTP